MKKGKNKRGSISKRERSNKINSRKKNAKWFRLNKKKINKLKQRDKSWSNNMQKKKDK